MTVDAPALFTLGDPEVVVPAPAAGPGNWSGAATAVLHDGVVYLTYRVRRPLTEGRGVTTVVARSTDGTTFEQVAEVHRDAFGAESFERPALLPRPEGGWRLFLSCATPECKHWWIEALDADTVEGLPQGTRTVVFPGDDTVAVKDPVVLIDDAGTWHAWLCEHPLTEAGHEDRMTTAYATSPDGLRWERQGTVLSPTPGSWDARGARVTEVLSLHPTVALYDGRATAEENWFEVTGIAREGADGLLHPEGDGPVGRSPYSDGALRYVTAIPWGEQTRYYAEAARPDGAHDLVSWVS
jgi:hypothetical protein